VRVLDLRALLETLNQHEVRFVVIGGVAVGAHGYVRATDDLDIVPDPSGDNLNRLARALSDVRATLPLAEGRAFQPAGDVIALTQRRNMTLDTSQGALDIVQRAAGVPSYGELVDHAVQSDLLGVAVCVCSLAHLRQMKEARGSAQDRADLEELPTA
jgi:hypothetical protein